MRSLKASTRTHLLVWILILLALLLITQVSSGQTENLNARDPYLKEGKMFTLVITPKSRQTEIFVTGNKIGDFRFNDLGLVARVKMGRRVIVLSPRKGSSSFVLEDIPSNGQLDLNLKYKTVEENFEIPLDQLVRP